MTRPPVRGERLFRALLLLYPAEFRRRYRVGMVEFYRDRRAAAGPRAGARGRLWIRLIADAVRSASAEHLRRLRESQPLIRRPSASGDARKDSPVDTLLQDLRLAVRGLIRTPAFTTVVLVTLALGIGANAAIFTVLEAVLLRPLPYRHAERVRVLWNGGAAPGQYTAVAAPEFFDYREQLSAFDAVAGIRPQVSTLLGREGEPERVAAYVVTPNFFDLLGAAPALGRSFQPGDGIVDGERVVVLSHDLWRGRFGGDTALIGREVNVAGLSRLVVGVMPPAIRFPDAPVDFLKERADLWIPSTYEQLRNDERGNQGMAALGRIRTGVTAAQADADLATLSERFRERFPARYGEPGTRKWAIVSLSLREQMVGSVRLAIWVLAGVVGLVLLIACVNVANLLLARGALRRREVAVRLALGASRGRVLRLLLAESVVLALAGGAIGLGIAWAGTPLLLRLDGGNIPRLDEARVSLGVLGFAFALSLITGLVAGAVPALRQSRADLRSAMGDAGRGATGSRAGRRFRAGLVASQVAMALVVLVAAGLLGRSMRALIRIDPGFTAEGVLALRLTLPRSSYDSAATVVSFYERLADRLGQLPGASAAAVIYPLPMSGEAWSGSFRVEGAPPEPAPHAEYAVAGPGYFRAMRIAVVEGREFGSTDARNTPLVAVVDEALAATHWPGASAIGKRINVGGAGEEWRTVVGVVRHVRSRSQDDFGESQLYLPLAQYPQRQMFAVARAGGGTASSLSAGLRTVVRDLDPALPSGRLQSLTMLADRTLAARRFNSLLIGIFATVALGLASVGLYGVMSYLVTQRTREIGIRVALGGQPRALRRMVLRESAVIALCGLAVGIVAALAVARLLGGLLFGVSPHDLPTYGVAAAILMGVGLVAAAGPARRATRVDPTTALRE